MMSATPEQDVLLQPPAPQQPPLPLSDPGFTPPTIVHGIDPEDETPPLTPRTLLSRDSVADVFTSISEKVTRAVSISRAEVTRAVSHVTQPPDVPKSGEALIPGLFLFGDSITRNSIKVSSQGESPGWSALLREEYADRVEVFVRGYNGYNTRWALRILPRLLTPLTAPTATLFVRAVLICFGANDAVRPIDAQHVPLDEYKRNLAKLVTFVRALPTSPLPILMTPPPISVSRQVTDERRNMDRTATYALACVETGRRLEVPVVDLHAAMLTRAESIDDGVESFVSDGLHLSDAGNHLVFELLKEVFAECVPEISPDSLSALCPDWKDIDLSDIAKSLGTSSLV